MGSDMQGMEADGGMRFPDPRSIRGNIIAVGGNLYPQTLINAYSRGIFPWYSENEPIIWCSLDPRSMIFLPNLHVSRRLRRVIKKTDSTFTVDTAFEKVITNCRNSFRPGQNGTWITPDVLEAYCTLHSQGYAHSVECWQGGALTGGLYGVSLGGCFCGESMFYRESNASKIAFIALCGTLIDAGFGMIDCQQNTVHLDSFGAINVKRYIFYELLQRELEKETLAGSWNNIFPDFPESALWREIRGS